MDKELLEKIEKIEKLATEVWEKAEEVVGLVYNLKLEIKKEVEND